LLCLAVFSLGFSAVITQLALLRELLSAFAGNEIGLGILLGVWLLLMGLGSFAGRTAARLKQPLAWLAGAQFLLALWPLLAVFLLRTLRSALLAHGVEAGVSETALGCLAILFPYCFASGYLLTLACTAKFFEPGAEAQTGLDAGAVYFFDSAGAIAGGVLFSFALIYFFSPFGALIFPACLNFFVAALLCLRLRNRFLAAGALLAALALCALPQFFDLEKYTTAREHPQAQVVFSGYSPYGKVVVTRSAGQFDFYSNNVPLFSTQVPEDVEEKVHYALAQRPQAKRVLLLSGGASGVANEILKYNVARVDFVELDPLLLEAGEMFAPKSFAEPRIHVIRQDARFFAQQASPQTGTGRQAAGGPENRYDVALIDLPEPSTAQLNRFYTREFFSALKNILAPGGVISFALGSYDDYLSPDLAQLIAVAHSTLKSVFAHVLILPGRRIYYLASDGPLDEEIAGRIEKAGVETRLMRRAYLSGMLTPERLAEMRRAAAAEAEPNEDFNPVLYYRHLRHWLGKFQTNFGLTGGILLAAAAICLVRLRAVPVALFSAGFAASALELLLLMGFQIIFGLVYQRLGILITAFMLGLALGSGAAGFFAPTRRRLTFLSLSLAAFACLLPWLLRSLPALGGGLLTETAFVALALLLAAMVGLQFALASAFTQNQAKKTVRPADLYVADFLGASLGALLAGSVLIPALGVAPACALIGGLNVFGSILLVVSG
jgi:spermidine synthase